MLPAPVVDRGSWLSEFSFLLHAYWPCNRTASVVCSWQPKKLYDKPQGNQTCKNYATFIWNTQLNIKLYTQVPKWQSLTFLIQHPTNCQLDYRVDSDELKFCSWQSKTVILITN
jgi:hypothetical protein